MSGQTEQNGQTDGGGRGRRAALAALQVVGFAGGVALLVWVVLEALSPENRGLISRLGDAGALQIVSLLGLSAATLVLNGSIFWVTILPEKPVPHSDIQATNAVATLLSYLPFKLSLICRVVIHNRRDGVPLLTIGAWFLAIGALVVTNLGPVVVASLVRKGVDTWWWVISVGGAVAATGLLVWVCSLFAHDRGLARIHRVFDPVPIGALQRYMRTESFSRLHAGFGMLAHPVAVSGATALRLADIGVQAARFVVAAGVLGITMQWQDAVIFAGTYFMIGMISPFGMLGTREGGTVAVYAAMGITLAGAGEGADPFKPIVLFVSATEALVYLAGAGLGVAWLRVDRLLLRRAGAAGTRTPNV